MKIMIDCRLASMSNRGMARYCRELVKCLCEINSEDEFYLIISEFNKFFEKLPQNFRLVKTRFSNYILSEQIDISILTKKIKPDILWCTSNTFPIFLRKKTKLVVTIHDLIFLKKLNGTTTLYKSVGKIYRSFILKFFSKFIYEYFTVSKYSMNEIGSTLKITNRVLLTPNCLSEEYIEKATKKQTEKKESFFFTVSGDSPSKNLNFLINLFNNKLSSEKLYIAGISETSVIRENGSENVIFLKANLTDEEIIDYYCKCKAFIFPSLEEGFGIPIIEALCCKAKVIASNKSCIPEILTNNGVLFDPCDDNSLISIINNLDKFSFSFDCSKYKSWKNVAERINLEFKNIVQEGV